MNQVELRYDEHDRYERALAFAQRAHGDQRRKYTGAPYWQHLVAVAALVSRVPGRSIEMIEAALLHDTLEDTAVKPDEIDTVFGALVRAYVVMLTDPPLSFGNRAARKVAVNRVMRSAPPAVKTIKLADLLDNTRTIVVHDPAFARIYMAEKHALLDHLIGGDQALWNHARAAVDAYYKEHSK